MAEQSRGGQSPGLLTTPPRQIDPYTSDSRGIYQPPTPVEHRDEEYPSEGFDALAAMQRDHFWYRGRHRFILHFTRRMASLMRASSALDAIDLGGGCGGWVNYLERHEPGVFRLALADSSALALDLARPFVSPQVTRYQIDLLNLQWSSRWDLAFMLDVLEHIPDDIRALQQVRAALRPGGFLITTTPALERFRTPIDDMSRHVRRYSRADLVARAATAGLELVTTRYFMFFLSPLLLLSRRHIPDPSQLTPAEIREYMRKSAEIPPAPLNAALSMVFALETPLGAWLPFPWGTSVLAVFRRPST
ncbi:MAG TPA: class I SAM-dependent methyltransferase [Vicinamibacterales bacterium]|nr:class I SAM-dependent methyltransferase [Vicinamibacterales bacterium]